MKKKLFKPDDLKEELKRLGALADDEIDPAWAALVFAAIDQPGVSIEQYQHQLEKLADEVGQDFAERVTRGEPDNLETRVAALARVLAGQWGFLGDVGDEYRFEDLQNASLIRVLERRKGLPEALGILYIYAARAQGWTAEGLKFPAYFVVRIEHAGQRVLIDPFLGGRQMEAADLRTALKKYSGENAELSHDYYDAIGNRELVVRMINHVKLRLVEASDYLGAADLVEHMRMFAPGELRLLLDAGVLQARIGNTGDAVTALERYIAETPDYESRYDAEMLLEQIKAGII